MGKQSSKKPLPKCKAFLLCERCIIEERTRCISLINLFDTFRLKTFPSRCPSFFAFVQLVDGIGRYQLEIEVHDLEDDSLIGRSEPIVAEFPVRPMRRSFSIPIRSLVLPREGRFDFILLGNGAEIER